jgi:subtilase family serine protease
MRRFLTFFSSSLPVAAALLGVAVWLAACLRPAVESGAAGAARIDEQQRLTLAGNVHPLARTGVALGAVSSGTRLEQMLLVLKAQPGRQAELDGLVAAQQDTQSAEYHQWVTPEEFGVRFGAAPEDVARVTAWLGGHGFEVDDLPAGGRLVVFSGTAGQVEETFHAGLERYNVEGAAHIANSLDPEIPSALSGVVAGVVSLNDFRSDSQVARVTPMGPLPEYTAGATHYVFPADFAAIYDLTSLFQSGTTGEGAAIAVAARSNIALSDVASFRSAAGLPANQPVVLLAGSDPGLVAGDRLEATLDAEWAGAAAPGAAVKVVVAPSTATTDGIDLAAAYIVNHAVAPVLSVSYGECEYQMGAAQLAFYNSLWQQAAAEGISVFVASGDAGASGCSAATSSAGMGPAVNGLCSSPYATCVGGTQFNEGGNASYWSSTNASGYASALSYIPEQVWNESALAGGSGLWASGGGISTAYAQPLWQQEVSGTAQAGGMRAVPDVALMAARHDGAMVFENGGFAIVSGTSVSAPAFAGVMALVVAQQNGAGQGNANPRLYALAGAGAGVFHTTQAGDNSVPGVTGFAADGAEYNLATGLGSVDGAVLVSRWALQAQPCGTRLLRVRCGGWPPRTPLK